jgi:phosphodiesterase/alkaline phosphatase D-like protein
VGASSTLSGATISWTTNEASNSQVDYGTTPGYGSSTALVSTLVTSHSASLSGLQAATLYHYRVKSRDAAGNLATSADFTFTTAGDTTAPTISGVGASSITVSGATISWSTNEASDSQVDYGTTRGYGSSTTLVSTLVSGHSVSLSGLQGATLYHYRVKSRNAAGNLATSADFTFTTTDDSGPFSISGLGASSITVSGATISWTTNRPSDSQVEYGTTMTYGSSTTLISARVTSHSVSLSGLQAATLYHYRVKSGDVEANLAVSSDRTFVTADASDTIFTEISLSNLGNNSVTINWRTSKETTGSIEYGPETVSDYAVSDLNMAANHATQLSGLFPSTRYQYRITATDANNHRVASSILVFKTLDQLNQPAQPSSEAIFITSVIENARFRSNLGINNTGSEPCHRQPTLVDKQGIVLNQDGCSDPHK